MDFKYRTGLKTKIISNQQRMMIDEKVLSLGITGTQSRILGYVSRQPGMVCQKDIEQEFGISRPTANGILHRLEERGFVHCCTSDTDRRIKQIVLTEKAVEIRKDIDLIIAENEQLLVSGFSEEEVILLNELLDRVLKNTGFCGCNTNKKGDCDK